MITPALTSQPNLEAQSDAQFTAEGAPPPGNTSGTSVPGVPEGVGALPPPTASIFIEEWDMLMTAVQDRLRLAVGAAPHQGHDGVPEPVRARVLECVRALHQLHVLLLHTDPSRGAESGLRPPAAVSGSALRSDDPASRL